MEEKELLENTSLNEATESIDTEPKEATLADLIGGEDETFSAKFATQGAQNIDNSSNAQPLETPKKKRSFKSWLCSIIPTKRRIAQLYFALLFNANLKGYVQGNMFVGKSKFICSPGINCYSCPGAIGTCPLGALQNELGNKRMPFYILGILFLYGLMLGRTICGWLCPFGLFQDLIYKIKTPKLKKSGVTRALSYLKYVILAVFVFILAGFGIFPAFCKYICPAGILEGAFGILPHDSGFLSMLGSLFTWKFVLFVSIVIFCIFAYRAFCRFICPLGAIYSLFNRFSFFGIKLNRDKCTKCGKCVQKCKLDIKHVGDQECISCGECIDVCPTKAISFKGPKIFLAPNEISIPKGATNEERAELIAKQERENAKIKKKNCTRKIIIGSVMGVVLVSVLFYFNVIKNQQLWDNIRNLFDSNPPVTTDTDTSSENNVTVGTAIGNKLPSSSLQVFDENGLKDEFVDPATTGGGKVTVINFWGTWCPPCVAELPHFSEVASEYSDSVVIYAVHSVDNFDIPINDDYGTAPEFVAKNHKDSDLIFLKDTRSSGALTDDYFKLTTGKGFALYPWTIVLDENGVITYTASGDIEKDVLIAEIEKAMNN